MPRRRLVVALLFIAAGITPLAALGAAWGDEGWTADTTVIVTGRAARSFPASATPSKPPLAAAPAAPGTATQTAPVPQAAQPTGASIDEPEPTGKPSQTRTADPAPTETATAPADPAPTGQPSEAGN